MRSGSNRLAIYGFVDRQAGSVASANWVILDGLLRRGWEIDFYGVGEWIRPKEFESHPRYRRLSSSVRYNDQVWAIANRVPGAVPKAAAQGVARSIMSPQHMAQLKARAIEENARRPYAAMLSLGLMAPFRIPGVPTVSWPQGPPTGEQKGILSQRDNIIRYEGRAKYLAFKALYARRVAVGRRELRFGDIIICGSQWARTEWIAMGSKPESTFAIPYPFDLSMYEPKVAFSITSRPINFLWLGRIVPRKRLDLALEALAITRKKYDARLRIFGGFSYSQNFRKMLDNRQLSEGVEYSAWIDRSKTPAMLHQCDVLIQPSEYENLGSGPLEAQACGLPVVLGPTNGTRDYVCANSVVFEQYTPEAVASAMIQIFKILQQSDPLQVVNAARESAEKSVSVDRVLNALDAVLKPAASQGSSRFGG